MRARGAMLLLGAVAVAAIVSCDRNVAPFDPDEQPAPPDLSRIFPDSGSAGGPAGAGAAPAMPPAPGGATRGNVAAASADGGAPIRGRVELGADLAGAVPASATLFVVARRAGAAGGPPLAVLRLPDPALPLDFEIGPNNVMIQGMPFSGDISLSARLDADGDAMTRAPGDLSGELASPVQPGSTGVRIVLDTKL